MKNFNDLNEYQKAAVRNEDQVCLLNACVGSGKTTVLIEKIRYLHEVKKIPYTEMIVLTFTNKAAGEIRNRLGELEMGRLGTFHGVALKLLQEDLPLERIGYTREFAVIDPAEEQDMALQLIQERNLVIKYKNRLAKRLEQAGNVQDPAKRISKYKDDIFLLLDQLKEEKKRQNKMSFSDLILYTVELLRDQDSLVRPSWLIVDEVQDCDLQQLEFLDALKGENTSLFAVGDPNQVIYSWRGSAFHIFYQLRERYQATELTLPVNYRCREEILRAAKRFSQNGIDLTGEKSAGGKVRIKRQYDSFQEAVYLAEQIKELNRKGIPNREIAIFYRLQKQAVLLAKVLRREGICCEIAQKQNIRDIPVLNWTILLLKASLNPSDRTSRVLCLMDKKYGYGMTQKKALAAVEKESGLLEKMAGFSAYLEQEAVCSKEGLYDYFALDEFLHPTSSAYPEDKEQVLKLFRYILDRGTEKSQIKECLNHIALDGTDWSEQMESDKEERVHLMTLHASKGLEFSHVFIIGVNAGSIPLSSKASEEEEERRLFFVGMTRAKEYLELSYYTNPNDCMVRPGMSPYLSLLPKAIVEQVDEEPVNLRDLKKQILIQKRQNKAESEQVMEPEQVLGPEQELESGQELEEEQVLEPGVESEMSRRVRHEKYGEGTVISDDGTMIEVEFDDYGRKEFLAGFCVLEEIKE